jgi:hypothetical protein
MRYRSIPPIANFGGQITGRAILSSQKLANALSTPAMPAGESLASTGTLSAAAA